MREPDPEDWQLLSEYAAAHSDKAFRALVDRYTAMVYHAALRQTNDPHLAEEVTQGVFIALAQKASSISKNVLIGGWLFRATRYAVLNLARADRLRRRRETEAVAMQTTLSSTDQADPLWEQISPYLDEALAQLPAKDRDAVIIRYFGNRSHKETGTALGVSEDATKKRLARALEKLRAFFMKRGVVVPSLALATALSASAVKAAPTGMAATAAGMALKHAAGGVISSPIIAHAIIAAMAQARLKLIALSVLVMMIFAFQAGRLAVHASNPPVPQAVAMAAPTEPPPGRIVVWDKALPMAPTVNMADPTLEQALDRESVAAGGYWSVDYVVYDTPDSLQRLLETLRTGSTLQSGGWTNLCPTRPRPGDLNVVYKNSTAATSATAGLSPGAANIVNQGARALAMTAVLNDDGPDPAGPSPAKEQEVREAIDRSVKEGAAEGVLAPERLLAAVELLPKFGKVENVAPNRQSAAQLAEEAHAFWTIIYTLRRSPVQTVGVKLPHRLDSSGGEAEPLLDPPIVQDLESLGSNQFEFTPEELNAHNQAAQNWLNQQSGGKSQ